jgi:regulator of sigma E protease
MNEILGSIWWLAVTLGLLITFHEFGHYWVARRMGVKVLRFSIGFGKPLWTHVGRDGTEYVIAAVPLGGYVKMLDAREDEVPADQRAHEFTAQPVLARMAIVVAGPFFNFIFAVAAFWAMLVVGKPDYLPIVGAAQGLAAQAGVQAGDRLLRIDGTAVQSWSGAALALADAVGARAPTRIEVLTPAGTQRALTLPLQDIPAALGTDQAMQHIGLVPQQMLIPPVLGKILPDSAAAAAGLQPGDRIVAIAGQPVHAWNDVVTLVHRYAGPDRALDVRVERAGKTFDFATHPRLSTLADGKPEWLLGVSPAPYAARYNTVQRANPLAAIPQAVAETWRLTAQTVTMLGRMFTGQASLKNISGPISIAQYANTSADLGPAWFLYFLGIVSLSLAVMNLLPIPILDGGHLVYYLIELVKGSPVSVRIMVAGQYLGMALLVALMGLAFYNDLLRLIS